MDCTINSQTLTNCRCSKDVDTMDMMLPAGILQFVLFLFPIIAVFFIVGISAPMLLCVLLPVAAIFVGCQVTDYTFVWLDSR